MLFLASMRNLLLLYISVWKQGRERKGLPQNWTVVNDWLDMRKDMVQPNSSPEIIIERKWRSIPLLPDYENTLDEEYWETWPKKSMPKNPSTVINVEKLEWYIER